MAPQSPEWGAWQALFIPASSALRLILDVVLSVVRIFTNNPISSSSQPHAATSVSMKGALMLFDQPTEATIASAFGVASMMSCHAVHRRWRWGRVQRQSLIKLDFIEEMVYRPFEMARATHDTDGWERQPDDRHEGVWVWKASNIRKHQRETPVEVAKSSADAYRRAMEHVWVVSPIYSDEVRDLKDRFSRYWVS